MNWKRLYPSKQLRAEIGPKLLRFIELSIKSMTYGERSPYRRCVTAFFLSKTKPGMSQALLWRTLQFRSILNVQLSTAVLRTTCWGFVCINWMGLPISDWPNQARCVDTIVTQVVIHDFSATFR